jgi:two-component system, NarL family, nitrate/nitrite response regulator NarL
LTVLSSLSIALVDSHPLQLAGVVAALTQHVGFNVVATGTTAKDISDIAAHSKPDVMIVDLNMVDDTFDAIMMARTIAPAMKIIAFTSLANVTTVIRALDAGASGYVLNTSNSSELVCAVEAVRRGETHIAPCLTSEVIALFRSHSFRQVAEAVKFSDREEQVVRLLLRGKTNKEIAATLNISERTVKHYMTILMQKLNVRNRLEFVIAAQKLGQAEPAFGPRYLPQQH